MKPWGYGGKVWLPIHFSCALMWPDVAFSLLLLMLSPCSALINTVTAAARQRRACMHRGSTRLPAAATAHGWPSGRACRLKASAAMVYCRSRPRSAAGGGGRKQGPSRPSPALKPLQPCPKRRNRATSGLIGPQGAASFAARAWRTWWLRSSTMPAPAASYKLRREAARRRSCSASRPRMKRECRRCAGGCQVCRTLGSRPARR